MKRMKNYYRSKQQSNVWLNGRCSQHFLYIYLDIIDAFVLTWSGTFTGGLPSKAYSGRPFLTESFCLANWPNSQVSIFGQFQVLRELFFDSLAFQMDYFSYVFKIHCQVSISYVHFWSFYVPGLVLWETDK